MEFTFRLQTAARKNSATDFTNDIKLITLIVTLRIPAEKYNWKNQTTGQYLFEIFFCKFTVLCSSRILHSPEIG